MDNIFSGLENLGFDNLNDLKIYAQKEEKKNIIQKKTLDPITHLFDKQVDCPVCNASFKSKAVKVNSPRMKGQDSDLFIRYNIINPYLYDVWICNKCGYAAMKADFPKIKSFQKDIIYSSITPKWKGRKYPDVFDEKIAIERYKLALVNAIFMESKISTKAMICLKTAWMYRLLEDKDNEISFLTQALNGFNEAYSSEDFPIYGMHRYSIMYLIGELNRRVGNFDEALRWFSSVITTPGVPQKIKDLARDCKELIKDQQNK